MAVRSSLTSSLTIYVIMCLFLAHVSKFYPQPKQYSNLQTLMVTRDVSGVKFKVYPARTTSRFVTSSLVDMTKTRKLIRIIRLLNTALIANVILLSNDVQLNPGPQEMKGLRFFHLSICSLRNKVDELRLFCDMHKPHVLSVNETWLDESFSDEEVWLQVLIC